MRNDVLRRQTPIFVILTALLLGLPSYIQPAAAQAPVYTTHGDQAVLVIPVEFTDNTTTRQLSTFSTRMAQVNNYVMSASYNTTSVSYSVFPNWIQMNGTFGSFAYGTSLQTCPNIFRTVINAVQNKVNLSSFRAMMIVHVGSNFTRMRPEYYSGSFCFGANPIVDGALIVSQDDPTTLWVHEVLHSIGGVISGYRTNILRVEDLYDEGLAVSNVNSNAGNVYIDGWDIMSSGYGGMTAFTKMKLSWIPPQNEVTLSSWNNVILNISSLDVSTKSTQVIKIPISTSHHTLLNGTTVSASTYYLVEYRTQAGVDKNITSNTVLVTKGNDTRYYSRLPGPVIQYAELVSTRGIPTAFDRSMNLAVTVLHAEIGSAIILVTRPSDAAAFTSAGTKVNSALANASLYGRLRPSPFDTGPSADQFQQLASKGLDALVGKNITQATSLADQSQALIKQRILSLQLLYYTPVLIDILLLGVLLLYLVRSRPPANLVRVFEFTRRGLLWLYVLLAGGVGYTIYALTNGLVDVNYGIIYANQQVFSRGVTSIGWSLFSVFVVFGLVILTTRHSVYDFEPEPDEDTPAAGA